MFTKSEFYQWLWDEHHCPRRIAKEQAHLKRHTFYLYCKENQNTNQSITDKYLSFAARSYA